MGGFIIQLIDIAFSVFIWLIIIRCLLSFISHDPHQPIIRFIYDITEPAMGPFRRIVPPMGGLDLSPIALLFALELLRWILVQLVARIFY